MTNDEKAICIACRTFISNLETDEAALEAYNILQNEDGDEFAQNCVEVWEPFDQYDVDALINVIDALIDDIIRTFELETVS